MNITSVLSQAFGMWGRDCAPNEFSCGVCFYVGGQESAAQCSLIKLDGGHFWDELNSLVKSVCAWRD